MPYKGKANEDSTYNRIALPPTRYIFGIGMWIFIISYYLLDLNYGGQNTVNKHGFRYKITSMDKFTFIKLFS